jgi:hypothetical protein
MTARHGRREADRAVASVLWVWGIFIEGLNNLQKEVESNNRALGRRRIGGPKSHANRAVVMNHVGGRPDCMQGRQVTVTHL